jgi:hypothetical protein
VTPPTFTLSGSRLQKLGTTVVVSVLCPEESCRATAGGSVRVPQVKAFKARTFKLRALTKVVPRGQSTKFAVRLPATAVTAIRRALKARVGTSARLRIGASDAAGNSRTVARTVRLKL